jgi:hypothetical protein
MSLRNPTIWVCLLAGCAGPAIKSEPGSQRGEVAVELRTASKSGPGWQQVMPGASLDSGTEFAIRVTVSKPGFLYVGQRSAGGELTLLYPVAAAVRVEPSQPAELPDAGQWFRLDDQAGAESLFVLLSEKRQELDAAKLLLTERGEAACEKTRDPPPPEVKHRDRGGGVRGTVGPDGLTVLCFPFRHN